MRDHGASPGLGKGQVPAWALALLAVSVMSSPTGAAVGSLAFAALTPVGVVGVRQSFSALILISAVRPRFRGRTWAETWQPVLTGASLIATSICLTTAVDHIGVALSITLQFLGPLAVALASARGWFEVAGACAAAGGVYV